MQVFSLPSISHVVVSASDLSASNGKKHKTALVTGSVAVGAFLTGLLLKRLRRNSLSSPEALPPALEAHVGEIEMMEGRARYYERSGNGTPLVFLHSINAAGSSYETKPLFDAFARLTDRPLFALEWLGFGLSDRPPVRYTPALYQRQLRRFLSEHVHEPADVVALSLSCEFAAVIATTLPFLFRKLVFIAPTALAREDEGSTLQRVLVTLASAAGTFEIFFARLTQRDVLRRFYKHQVFLNPAKVPEPLVEYAFLTTHVEGASHAPRRFVEGSLFLGEAARQTYAQLALPTLLLLPTLSGDLVQNFDRADEVAARNPAHLLIKQLPWGLLPQWEHPEAVVEALTGFLE